MAPKRHFAARARARESASDAQATDHGQQPSPSQSQSHSQDILMNEFTERIDKMKEKAYRERKAEEKRIQEDKQKDVDKVQQRMNECRAQHVQHLRNLRRPKIERLQELFEQKRMLERKIEGCYAQIDTIYEATLEQYRLVVKGKMQDLTELSA